jgi:hypothetical protein
MASTIYILDSSHNFFNININSNFILTDGTTTLNTNPITNGIIDTLNKFTVGTGTNKYELNTINKNFYKQSTPTTTTTSTRSPPMTIYFIKDPTQKSYIYNDFSFNSINNNIDIYDTFKNKKPNSLSKILVGTDTNNIPVFLYSNKIYILNNDKKKFTHKYDELGGYPVIQGTINDSISPPPTNDKNDEYIIKSLLEDPSLNSIFTLANFNVEWNKASLIQIIQEILGNGNNPLNPQTIQPLVRTSGPTMNPDIPFLSGRNNTMTLIDANNRPYTFLNTTNNAGDIQMKIDSNQTIMGGSNIGFTYNVQSDNGIETSDGYTYSTNTGIPKCKFKKVCKEIHYYHPDCSQNFIEDSCNCNCSSEMVYNSSGKPHTHCENEDQPGIVSYMNNIQSIKFDINVPQTYTAPPSDNSTLKYDPDIDYLCDLIADYYILLIQDAANKNNYINNNIVQTNHQSYEDSNDLYYQQYMKIINISVGILSTGFFMYSILRN